MENENEKQLLEEIKALRISLAEAEGTISAIRGGSVDAIVVSGSQGEQVFTLTGAERAYRILIETMNEGAASLNREGLIIYCNIRLAEMLRTPLEKVIGAPLRRFIRVSDLPVFDSLMEKGLQKSGKSEVYLIKIDGTELPVLLSVSSMQRDNGNICGITVTDLTAQKHIEGELRRHRDNLEELVKDRTSELETSNQQLLDEEAERKQYFNLFQAATDIMVIADPNGAFKKTNPACTEILGYPESELLAKPFIDFVHPDDKQSTLDEMARQQKIGASINFENRYLCKDGSVRTLSWRATNKKNEGITYAVARDITEHRKLEAQLRQSLKMEAIGQLAGGVAHDFNNILSAIFGYSQLSLNKLPDNDPVKEYVEQIMKASERAAVLTQSLLAFSRKQEVTLAVIDASKLVKEFETFLRRLIREDIELIINCTGEPLAVMADRGQIEQVVMNLVTNGRDAMPSGGRLIIETLPVTLDQGFVETHGYGKAGEYALILVSDSGIGMDKETQSHIFEPFYTTKDQGKGTGLGLSMAYGIIKKHDGFINAYSELGKGTTFKIYLPCVQALAQEIKMSMKDAAPLRGGSETVLVCEDDKELRNLATNVLNHFGYRVIEAVDGQDAIDKFVANKENIDLVFIDAIMPKKNGKAANDEMKRVRPDLKTIFVSGYTRDIFEEGSNTFDENTNFLHKPYSPNELAVKIRELLDK